MRPEELLERLRLEPFQPFRVYATEDRVFDITRPRYVRVLRDALLVFYPDKVLPYPAADGHDYLALEDILRVEPLANAAASTVRRCIDAQRFARTLGARSERSAAATS